MQVETALGTPLAPPALRPQVLLNGLWEGGQVPVYAGVAGFDQATYRRRVEVPEEWQGQRVKVVFGAVNFVADVRVDGRQRGRHVGGWVPFEVDVTDRAIPGGAFSLEVEVRGPRHPPITDAQGAFAWPVGGWSSRGGIADDVWLRAFGPVHVADTCIRTAWQDRRLTVVWTVVNSESRARRVHLGAEAVPASGCGTPRLFAGPDVELAAGEQREVQASWLWPEVEPWWPDRPWLYLLTSRVSDGDEVLDQETRRFGFRDLAIVGNQFRLNGVRANLYGDYQVYGDTWYTAPELYTPENWPTTCAQILACHIRVLRWHHNPVPQYVLDVCDAQGLLICDESPNYARNYHKATNQSLYMANCRAWIPAWIRADRNHPCVYMWNATNEMTHDFCGPFDAADLLTLGDVISRHDPTRPVGYDGDPNVPGALLDHHYPEGYNREPVGTCDAWDRFLDPARPTGTGECLHTRSPLPEVQEAVTRNTWWLGVWLRGLRRRGWTNVKPACWWFQWQDGFAGTRAELMRNAYAPVALFDRGYDDLGIAPYVTGTRPGGVLPELVAGTVERRALVLHNDTFRGATITVDVLVTVSGAVLAQGRRDFQVELGGFVALTCEFQVPAAADGRMSLELRTWKDGRQTFSEAKRFRVVGTVPGATATEVHLG